MNPVQTQGGMRVTAVDRSAVEGFAAPHPWQMAPAQQPCGEAARWVSGRLIPSDSPYLDRASLAQALAQTHRRLGHALRGETVAAVENDACFVVAGQQPGLLLGPAYVLYKVATAIQLARRLSAEHGRTVLPAFWMAGEDHRLEPLLRCTVGGGSLVLPSPPSAMPASVFSLEPHLETIQNFLADVLDAPSRRRLEKHLNFQNGRTLADQFAQGLLSIFAKDGLVLIDPEALRSLGRPVLLAAAGRWAGLEQALAEGGESVRGAGFEPPIQKLSLFEIGGQGRQAIDPSQAANASALSPGVALRPLVQDALLPVVATVAGPTETLYLWQIDRLYGAMNIRRSAVVPRLSATVVDAQTAKQAAALGLEGVAMFGARQKLRTGVGVAAGPSQDASFDEAAEFLVKKIESHRTDGNKKILDKAVQSIRHQVTKVAERLARDKGADTGLVQLVSKIYPAKRPQERQPGSAAELIGRVGVDWLDALIDQTDALKPAHWLLVMDEPSGGGP